jgi:hypothetical protein
LVFLQILRNDAVERWLVVDVGFDHTGISLVPTRYVGLLQPSQCSLRSSTAQVSQTTSLAPSIKTASELIISDF